jgi:YVTN family beta-propeller protein
MSIEKPIAAAGRSGVRRMRLCAPLALALLGSVACDAAPTTELVYVSNEDSNDLSVISAQTNAVVATIAVGTRPRGVKASPDGSTVFVALSGSPKCPPSMPDEECEKLVADKSQDGIAEIDAATRTIRRVLPGGSDPEQFDVSWSRGKLYVSNEDANQATIVDLKSGAVERTIDVGREPEGVRLTPDGKHFYVTGETDHDVTIIDAATGAVDGKVSVGMRPRDVVFLSDGSRAYVSSELGGTVASIDTASRQVLGTITFAKEAKPMGLAISADDRLLYVATGRGKKVFVVDTKTNGITGSLEVGDRPWGIALGRDGKRLYTANGPSNDVSIVDADKLTVVMRIPVGKSPWGVAVAPEPARKP